MPSHTFRRQLAVAAATILAAVIGVRATNAPDIIDYGGWSERAPADAELRDWTGRYIALSVRHPKLTAVGRFAVAVGFDASTFENAQLRGVTARQRGDIDAVGGASDDMSRSLDNAWVTAGVFAGTPTGDRRALLVRTSKNPDLDKGERIVAVSGAPLTRQRIDDIARELADRELLDVTVASAGGLADRSISVNTDAVSRRHPNSVAYWQAALGAAVEPVAVVSERPLLLVPEHTTGPSAGLIHALIYLDMLTEGDLTGGLTVAGTGTISTSGRVGVIGGTASKTEAAVAAGADVMFVPPGNYDAAVAAADGRVEVVKVRSLLSAAQWLIDHGGRADGIFVEVDDRVDAEPPVTPANVPAGAI